MQKYGGSPDRIANSQLCLLLEPLLSVEANRVYHLAINAANHNIILGVSSIRTSPRFIDGTSNLIYLSFNVKESDKQTINTAVYSSKF
jgi:hypothetical protein